MEEIILLRTPLVEKMTTVATDPAQHPRIPVNLDIVFPSMPCFLIEPSMRTTLNSVSSHEITNSLKWEHIDQYGNVLREFNTDQMSNWSFGDEFHWDDEE